MKHLIRGSAALLISAAPLTAGGIERAPQSLAALFEAGNYAELSFGGADPRVKGTDAAGFSTGDVAQGYGFVGLAYKHQFNENLSGAIIIEQPFGADISYAPFDDGGSMLLGGTSATVDSTTFTALARWRFDNNFSVHGGIRGSKASGEVTLDGAAYGGPLPTGLSGYNVKLDDSWGVGYVVGGAYEIPDIAARISLTYNSSIEHDFDTTENILAGTSTTTVKTPQSVTLEGQTGIAADTLLFGSIRWVKWSEFKVRPLAFSSDPSRADGLVSLENTTTYTLGVGRKFTENWSGSVSLVYEPSGDDMVSPLAPTNGRKGITLAAIYTMDNIKISTGINYSKLGDASPQTSDTERARMRDSEVWGVGVRIGYSF
ncbi:Long-chain fatty acid transport protein [Paracoccus alcaliphilus]|uniref:Long-chain fatty acid transport protein n=1 Tax=Paracoccus alcaliphilus TaxID=34002 RepID=A0A1H8J242_9RHOB|nr:outer membrane protein transport protein [Paracoccus alcaliphilus]WCR16633.1 outer membrane protein transport protein [Paracoccus alcaliphilus]SEN74465.1 Long-chain fatty acid transport protein [Paracoccus alcaliphilus]